MIRVKWILRFVGVSQIWSQRVRVVLTVAPSLLRNTLPEGTRNILQIVIGSRVGVTSGHRGDGTQNRWFLRKSVTVYRDLLVVGGQLWVTKFVHSKRPTVDVSTPTLHQKLRR